MYLDSRRRVRLRLAALLAGLAVMAAAGGEPIAPPAIGASTQAVWLDLAYSLAAIDESRAPTLAQVGPLVESVQSVLPAVERMDQTLAAQVRAILMQAKHPVTRHLAAGAEAVAELRTTPIEMRFTAFDGREIDLAKMRGKVILLDFRGITHCAACEGAERYMKPLFEKYHDQGFEIVMLADDMPSERVSKDQLQTKIGQYLKSHQLSWPLQADYLGYHPFKIERANGEVPSNPFFFKYANSATPTFMLIDKQGLLVERFNSLYLPSGVLDRMVAEQLNR